ncbi:MAG: TolC family protein [Bacteroidetes bacterium]|nr:TolC family protein [Bacteroidota bacterium]MBS1930963.1 TolC family protein [Bacteroidota bacterium]
MKPNRLKVRLLPAILLLSHSVFAQPAPVIHEFSVQQAVDYAKKNSVQVKNALLDVQIQDQTNRDFTSAAYPKINGSFNMVYNAKVPVTLVPAEFFGGTPGTYEKFPFGIKWNATGGISLDQLLFDGQVFVGLQARKTVLDFTMKNVEVTEELIKSNIYKVYYQLLAGKTQIGLLDANIDRLQKLLSDTREIYKNGFAEKLDLDKVSVQIANLETEKLKVINQIGNGYLGLKLLMGMPVHDSLRLTDTISYEQVRENLPQVSDFKYIERKEYQYAELGIKLGRYNIRRYKLSRYPTISLNAYYNENAQRNKFTFFSNGDWFPVSAISLHINVPIFNGFSTRAKIQQATLELQKSINQQEALKLSIDNEIETAKNNFTAAVATLDFQKKNMELAEQVYNQTRKKFDAGVGSNTEITAAHTDLKAAQGNYISALYDAIIAKVDYLKALGKL